MDYQKLLTKLKFTMTRTCKCGGTYTEVWQRGNPLTIVKVSPNKDKFWVHSSNPKVGGALGQMKKVLIPYIQKRTKP